MNQGGRTMMGQDTPDGRRRHTADTPSRGGGPSRRFMMPPTRGDLLWVAAGTLVAAAVLSISLNAVTTNLSIRFGGQLAASSLGKVQNALTVASQAPAIALLVASLALLLAAFSRDWGTWRGAGITVLTWVPQRNVSLYGLLALSSVGLVVSSGYRLIPDSNSDVVSYFAMVRSVMDHTFAAGDHPIRSVAGGLYGYRYVFAAAASVIGFDVAAFVLSVTGCWILLLSILRISEATGASRASSLAVAHFGMVATWGKFGYLVSLPSNGVFEPTPRYLGMALAALAISFVIRERLLVAVVVGLGAAVMHELDGFVPVVLALSSGLVLRLWQRLRAARANSPSSRIGRSSLAWVIVAVGIALIVAAASTSSVLLILSLGTFAVLALTLLLTGPATRLDKPERSLLFSILILVFTSVVLAVERGPASATATFFERVQLFEAVLQQLRSPGMIGFVTQNAATTVVLVALALFGVVALLTTTATSSTPEHERSLMSSRRLAWLSAAAMTMVTVGGVLQDHTALPLIASIWPNRFAWLLIPAVLAAFALLIDRLRVVPGAYPTLVVGAFMFTLPRVAISLAALIVAAIALALSVGPPFLRRWDLGKASRELWRRTPRVIRWYSSPLRMTLPIALAGALTAGAVELFIQLPPPELTRTASRTRLAHSDSALVAMAIAAEQFVPINGRILIPPNPEWGSFRILSGRGVAFEWKYFSSETELWYSQFRWMCDPQYRFEPMQNYGAVTLQAISTCYQNHSTADIQAIANKYDATHAIVRPAHWDEVDYVLAVAPDSSWELVELPATASLRRAGPPQFR